MPIEFFSRRLTDAEVRYGVSEKECLAMVCALERWHAYVHGTEVRVITDHKPLLAIDKTNKGRLMRWRLRMAPYNIKAGWLPERELSDADAMSRDPDMTQSGMAAEALICFLEQTPCSGKDGVIAAVHAGVVNHNDEDLAHAADIAAVERRMTDMRDMQERCEEILAMRAANHKNLKTKEGLLYWEQGDTSRIIAPKEARPYIMYMAHGHQLSGHRGETQTIAKIRKTFWWKSMTADITEWIRTCACAKASYSGIKDKETQKSIRHTVYMKQCSSTQ